MECQRCPLFPFVKGISQFKIPDAFDKFKDMKYKEFGIRLRDLLGEACSYCSMNSNDDNPSNHGRTFVSLDDAENVGGEYNDAKQDYIISNAKEGFSESSLSEDPYESVAAKDELEHLKLTDPKEYKRRVAAAKEVGYTHLPSEVEQVLKRELMSFASLEIQDMMLLCCCMKGITISEFSTMRWFPRGMLFKNSQTLKPVTKQASHARFMNIIKKFPHFKAVARYLRPDGMNKGGGFRGTRKGEKRERERLAALQQSQQVADTTQQTKTQPKVAPMPKIAKKNAQKKDFTVQDDFFLK